MATLYQLSSEYLTLYNELTAREFNAELITDTIESTGLADAIHDKADGLYVSLMIDTQVEKLLPTKQDVAGVDVNVKRFNYNGGVCEIYPKKLERYYSKITFYQRVLARKREDNPHNFKTKRYTKVKTKLRREYQKVANLQNDILQKFTSDLITQYGEIHIED